MATIVSRPERVNGLGARLANSFEAAAKKIRTNLGKTAKATARNVRKFFTKKVGPRLVTLAKHLDKTNRSAYNEVQKLRKLQKTILIVNQASGDLKNHLANARGLHQDTNGNVVLTLTETQKAAIQVFKNTFGDTNEFDDAIALGSRQPAATPRKTHFLGKTVRERFVKAPKEPSFTIAKADGSAETTF